MRTSKILCASVFALLLPLHAFAGSSQSTTLGGTLPDDPDQTQQEPTEQPTQKPTQKPTQPPVTQQPTPQQPAPQQTQVKITAEERTVLQTIHMTNINEIKASLIAFEKVTSPEIRDYAWEVLQDHVALEEKIIALGKKYSFELVSMEQSLVASQTEAETFLTTLKDTPDAEFAGVFLSGMATAHETVLVKLEGWQELKLASDIDSFLDESIMDIKEHQELAQSITVVPFGAATN